MADTLDILSEAEAQKAALAADVSGHESEIARMNTNVSRRIDALCGPVVQREVTEYHDGGSTIIRPRQTPVASVTTLKEWDGSTLTTLTEDDWGTAGAAKGFWIDQSSTYAHSCRIERRASGTATTFTCGSKRVELVYQAGRYADTDSVDARFKDAAAAIMRRLWKREGPIWAQSSDLLSNLEGGGTVSGFFRAIDPMVAEFLADEMHPPAVA